MLCSNAIQWLIHILQQGYSTLPSAHKWLEVYRVYEKVQMTGFTIQEAIISGLYLWETRKILRPGKIFQRQKTRKVMYHLVWVNIFIIVLDLTLLATEYANLFMIQTVFKAAIYSLKLRFEFVVLNQLMEYVQGRSTTVDLSGDPSGAEGGSRTARSIPLDAVKGRNTHNGPADAQSPASNNYSAFASKSLGSNVDSRNVDGVLRTTEVLVHDAPKSQQDGMAHAPPHEVYPVSHGPREAIATLPNAHTRSRMQSSPSSSEVEFAGKGY